MDTNPLGIFRRIMLQESLGTIFTPSMLIINEGLEKDGIGKKGLGVGDETDR